MIRIALAALAVTLLLDPAFAQATIEGQKAFGWLQPYVETIVSSAILFVLGWLSYVLKNKWGIEIDTQNRDALHKFLERQAGSLVADGFVKVNGLKFDVGSAALATAANTAGTAIPGVLQHFNITPGTIGEMIKDKIPSVPAAAQVAAAQATVDATVAAAAETPKPPA